MKESIKAVQNKLGVSADGIAGAKTWSAISAALGVQAPAASVWPTQAQVRSGGSVFGAAGITANLVNVTPPYPLYYDGKQVATIRVHKEIAAAVSAALTEVLEHYGQEQIKYLGLDDYGGSYNYRTTTNGGVLSMHAWGIALDFAPARNAYNMKAPKASLSVEACHKWWEIWERHGAVSLGREKDYDWMHVQFARLS